MRFRTKVNIIQCVRTIYDGDKGRGIEKVIGSLPQDSEFVPTELRELLTEDELKELSGVLFDRWLERSNTARKEAWEGLTATLKLAREVLKAPLSEPLSEDATTALWAELDELRRDLRAAGLPKPKPKPKAQDAM